MRADAVRNHEAVLAAADTLFSSSPVPAAVSMDDIAAAAGVGKGTLFRRFGDRDGLIRAVYDERTRTLRESVEAGTSPFGPTTPPDKRLKAFLNAIVQVKLDNRHLSLALEGGTKDGAYLGRHYSWAHRLLSETISEVLVQRRQSSSHRSQRALEDESNWIAHCLLAMTRADFIEHALAKEDMSPDQLRSKLVALAEKLTT